MRNTTALTTTSGIGLLVLLISGCSQSKDAAYVRDDVYDRPDPRSITAAVAGEEKTVAAPEQTADYYNPGEAERYANPRGYYDMAYNDPYYYGYDRYGFGMSYGNQWGYNSWSNGYGYGNVWNDPYWNGYGSYGSCNGWNNGYNNGWGHGGGWNNGYGSGYYNGCGCGNSWNSPYNYGGYNGYGYYGYGGGCYNCYQPIVTSGGEGWGGGTVYSHRPSFGGGSGGAGNGTSAPVGQRMNARDQIGLMKPLPDRTRPAMSNGANTTRPNYQGTGTQPRTEPTTRPAERPRVIRNEGERREKPEVIQRDNNGGRTINNDRNTGGGNNGGGSGGRRPR